MDKLQRFNEIFPCPFRKGYRLVGCGCGGKPKRIDTTHFKCDIYTEVRYDNCQKCWEVKNNCP